MRLKVIPLLSFFYPESFIKNYDYREIFSFPHKNKFMNCGEDRGGESGKK